MPTAFGGVAAKQLLEDGPQFDAAMYLALHLREAGTGRRLACFLPSWRLQKITG